MRMTKRQARFCNRACAAMWIVLSLGAVELAAFGVKAGTEKIREANTVCIEGRDRGEGGYMAEDAAGSRFVACRASRDEGVGMRPEAEDAEAAETKTPEAEDAEAATPETAETENDEADAGTRDGLVLVDTFLATAYCDYGTTATGTTTTEGRTIAVNPTIIPYGTHLWLYLDDGTLVGDYWAEDTGGNLREHPYVIDIYMPEYDDCMAWGVQHVSVYTDAG